MLKPKLTVIDSPQQVTDLTLYLSDKDLIAYDCETTGVHKGAEVIGYSVCADESEAFYVILAAWSVEKQCLVYFDTLEASLILINSLKGKRLIMHNGLFDCMMAESYFKIKLIDSLHTDTMVLAHLLDENRRVGLKDLAVALFGLNAKAEAEAMKASVTKNGGLLTKKCYEMYKSDAYLMGKYGAQDALLTFKLFMHLVPELYEQGLDQFFYEDESMPLLRGSTYQLNNTGLQVDTKALATLKRTLEAECLEAKDFIYKEIDKHIKTKYPATTKKNVFNIGSSNQLSWLLFGELELEFSTLTKEGKNACRAMGIKVPYTQVAKRNFIYECAKMKDRVYQQEIKINGKVTKAKKVKDPWAYIACDKKTLQRLAPKFKWIERLLEYQRKTKILTTYVKGIESRVQYGIIHPSFLQTGTTSGRYSSRNPNFQNLPRDDKRIKECIIARPGKVFVGADYSQLEPRVFAYSSGDERLKAAFKTSDDFYSVIGMEVYGKTDCVPRKDGTPDAFGIKYKKLRDLSKVIALASTYGATAHQLAPTTGKSIDGTQEDIDSYFERFPDVAKMMINSHKEVKRDGQVVNIFGRPRRIPEAKKIDKIYGKLDHAELPYDARNMLNLAVNHKIQSTGASIVNRAAIRFHKLCLEANIDCNLVCQVHDSLIAECKAEDADNVLLLLRESMENTVKLEGIELEALPKIGGNLAEV